MKKDTKLGTPANTAQKSKAYSLSNRQLEAIRQDANISVFDDRERFKKEFKTALDQFYRLKSITIDGGSSPNQKRAYLDDLTQNTQNLISDLEKIDIETSYQLLKAHPTINSTLSSNITPLIEQLTQLYIGAKTLRNNLKNKRATNTTIDELRALVHAMNNLIKQYPESSISRYNHIDGRYTGDLVNLVSAAAKHLITDHHTITNNSIGDTIKQHLTNK